MFVRSFKIIDAYILSLGGYLHVTEYMSAPTLRDAWNYIQQTKGLVAWEVLYPNLDYLERNEMLRRYSDIATTVVTYDRTGALHQRKLALCQKNVKRATIRHYKGAAVAVRMEQPIDEDPLRVNTFIVAADVGVGVIRQGGWTYVDAKELRSGDRLPAITLKPIVSDNRKPPALHKWRGTNFDGWVRNVEEVRIFEDYSGVVFDLVTDEDTIIIAPGIFIHL